jgi:anti-sigma factor RsiW
MNCEQAGFLLDAYVDQELDIVRSLEVETHVQSCAGCQKTLESLQVLRRSLRRPEMYYPAPGPLVERIRSGFGAPTKKPTRMWRSRSWLAAAAGLVLMVMAGQLFVMRSRTERESELARDVMTSHVRSLMGDHLLDVRSSDHHTVKPWFTGKLDYSPPVENPTAQGFPLIGARIDYLNGRNVSALVYQRRKHLINCYVYPEQHRDTSVVFQDMKGFHAGHWWRRGMAYWVISDLNQIELGQFASALNEHE